MIRMRRRAALCLLAVLLPLHALAQEALVAVPRGAGAN